MAAESTNMRGHGEMDPPPADRRKKSPLSHLLTMEDLVELVTTGEALAGTIDHAALLTRILETAGQLTDSPDASILLYDPRRKSLYFAAAIGDEAAFLLKEFGEQAPNQIPENSNAGVVFRKQQTQIKLALKDDPSHFKGVDEATQKKTQSMITVPLVAAQECIGVMQVLNKRTGDYTKRDQILLEQFASQAAVALRNARLIADLLAHMGLYLRGQEKHSAQELIKLLSTPPRYEKMTIMFADLRGFRSLCQWITSPQKLAGMLDQFLSMLVDKVLLHDGVVNKYLGDGILAFFRKENHELSAVNCAFAIVDAFAPLKEEWINQTNADVSFVDVGMGICTEQVAIGPVGSERVKDYTVIGNTVNLAAAFESEARGEKQVLVDQPTFHKVKDSYASDEPVIYELRLPGQPRGNLYKQFNLHRKKSAETGPIRCFISFSHKDQAFVDANVVEVLKREQIEPWIAPRSIEAGKQFHSEISKGLKSADYVIVVVSENSATSDWVKREIGVVLSLPELKDRIIPVLIDKTEPKEVDLFLSSIEAIPSKDLAKAARRFTQIVAAIRTPV